MHNTYKYFILSQFEAYRCLCFMRGPIQHLSRVCSSRASQGGFWALGRLGVFSHIMKCGLLAGHSQQGHGRPEHKHSQSLKTIHQNRSTREANPSISLSETDTETDYWGRRKESYSFLVDASSVKSTTASRYIFLDEHMYYLYTTKYFYFCFQRSAILLCFTVTLYFAKERPCSFLFVVFGNASTFPALLQFSLNTTVIGLISFLRPGGKGGGGKQWWELVRARQRGPTPQRAICTLGWQYSLDFSASTTIPPFKGCLWADPGSQSVETDINQHRKAHQDTQPHNIQKSSF